MLSLTMPLHLGQVSGSPSVPLILATSMPCTGRRVSAESASVQSPQPAPDDHIEIQKILQFLKKQIGPMTPISCHFISALYYSAHTLRCPKICQGRFRQGLKRIQTYISTNVLLCICIQDFIWLWLKVARHLWLHGISIKIFVAYKAACHACLLHSHTFIMQYFNSGSF